jgi:hypothetical protein
MRISRRGALKGLVAGIVSCLTLDVKAETKTDYESVVLDKGPITMDGWGYDLPIKGEIPEQIVFGDTVQVPTYDIRGAIDYQIEHGDDKAWSKIVELAGDSKIVTYDNPPSAEELQAHFKQAMLQHVKVTARLDREEMFELGKRGPYHRYVTFPIEVDVEVKVKSKCDLTDVYMSPEALEDISNWGVDQIDEATRKEILCNDTGEGNLRRCCTVEVTVNEA